MSSLRDILMLIRSIAYGSSGISYLHGTHHCSNSNKVIFMTERGNIGILPYNYYV